MSDCFKLALTHWSRSLFAPLACLLLFFSILVLWLPSEAKAQLPAQCSKNNIGDFVCPPNVSPYGGASGSVTTVLSGASLFGSGSPIFSAFGNLPGMSGSLSSLQGLFGSMASTMQSALMIQSLSTLNGNAGALPMGSLVSMFQQVQTVLNGLQQVTCPGGIPLNGSYLAYAQNAVAQQIAQTQNLASFNPANIVSTVCSNISTTLGINLSGGGTGGLVSGSSGTITAGGGGTIASGPQLSGYPPIDANTTQGARIAQCAVNSIGMSTADNPLTQGGALGCALAVSRIVDCAGYGVGQHVGTGALYSAFNSDPCYTIVDTGHVTAQDAMNLEPGDVFVTQRGSRAGHTGIYIGNGDIISNSSSGFNGSNKGTVQQNYTVDKWSSVTSRNPGGSAVFRRTCP